MSDRYKDQEYEGVVALRILLSVFMLVSIRAYAQAEAPRFVEGQVIIKFKKGTSVQSFNAQSASIMGMQHQGGWSNLNLQIYSTATMATVQGTIEELQNNPDVEYVEPNYILSKTELEAGPLMTKESLEASGDYDAQSGFTTMTAAVIHAEDAWAAGVGTATPVVAIIDSGVDMAHPALADAIWSNSGEIAGNGMDDDHNGYVDDIRGWDFVQGDNNPSDGDGHGTHVAGIVRGTTEDLFSIGTAKIRIMPVRFLDNTGSGSTADAIKAIYYAVNNGATILNNSWGGSSYSRALLEAIAYSYQQHTLFVAASGNATQNTDTRPMYPASYDVPNILSVAATDDTDTLAWFSNYGSSSVQVAAPGQGIYSSYPSNQYRSMSGTSMATPFVAGIAALMAREQPSMWGYQLKQLIMSTGDYKAGLTTKVSTATRVNVLSAVTGAQNSSLSLSQPDYQLSVSGADRGVASSLAGGGCGRVTKMYSDFNKSDGGGGQLDLALVLLVSIPVLMVVMARSKKRGYERKHERFEMESTVKMKIGDKTFEGKVDTISMGGAGINMPVHLEAGSVLTMSIAAPDGRESITVQGKIVWSNESQDYGISFAQVEEGVQDTIQQWTTSLAKSRG